MYTLVMLQVIQHDRCACPKAMYSPIVIPYHIFNPSLREPRSLTTHPILTLFLFILSIYIHYKQSLIIYWFEAYGIFLVLNWSKMHYHATCRKWSFLKIMYDISNVILWKATMPCELSVCWMHAEVSIK